MISPGSRRMTGMPPPPPPPLRALEHPTDPQWREQQGNGDGSIAAGSVSRPWKPKRGGLCPRQTETAAAADRHTDRPARLRLPPQLRQETSLSSESARHDQPDLTGNTPVGFSGCRTYESSVNPPPNQQGGSQTNGGI